MPSLIYCIPSGSATSDYLQAAQDAGCGQITKGVPIGLQRYYNGSPLPTVVTVPDPPFDQASANQTTLRDLIAQSLGSNKAYVASNPTNLQLAAQVKALTRQVSALTRLLLGSLDEVD